MKTNIFAIGRLTYFPSTAGLGVDSSLLLSSPFSNEEREIRVDIQATTNGCLTCTRRIGRTCKILELRQKTRWHCYLWCLRDFRECGSNTKQMRIKYAQRYHASFFSCRERWSKPFSDISCDQKEAIVKVSAKRLWRRRMREHKW